MKPKALLLLACFLATDLSVAQKRMRPPDSSDLAGSWVGYEESGLDFYRLDLRPDGTGFLAVTYMAHPPEVHRVARDELQKFKVRFTLTPLSEVSEPLTLKGDFYYSAFELTVSGAHKLKWSRKLHLVSLGELERRLHIVAGALEAQP